jgi:hypothetical protein
MTPKRTSPLPRCAGRSSAAARRSRRGSARRRRPPPSETSAPPRSTTDLRGVRPQCRRRYPLPCPHRSRAGWVGSADRLSRHQRPGRRDGSGLEAPRQTERSRSRSTSCPGPGTATDAPRASSASSTTPTCSAFLTSGGSRSRVRRHRLGWQRDAARPAQGPMPPREAAALVETLARHRLLAQPGSITATSSRPTSSSPLRACRDSGLQPPCLRKDLRDVAAEAGMARRCSRPSTDRGRRAARTDRTRRSSVERTALPSVDGTRSVADTSRLSEMVCASAARTIRRYLGESQRASSSVRDAGPRGCPRCRRAASVDAAPRSDLPQYLDGGSLPALPDCGTSCAPSCRTRSPHPSVRNTSPARR